MIIVTDGRLSFNEELQVFHMRAMISIIARIAKAFFSIVITGLES
ncbi:hypothetical protein [Acetobacterium wieringae]|jgi:hypothetical protein|nr:hypothetical protein [Acetobacterium wieringae]